MTDSSPVGSAARTLSVTSAASHCLWMGRRLPGRSVLAAALVILLLPAAGRPEALICGQPAHSRVAVHRESRMIAVFAVAEAVSVAERRRGLMDCPALAPGTGMLFVYADSIPRVFWMKNTRIELGIVFIGADGRISAIERGLPQSLKRIPSPGPTRLVLEVNYDEARNLEVGDRIARSKEAPGPKASPRPDE